MGNGFYRFLKIKSDCLHRIQFVASFNVGKASLLQTQNLSKLANKFSFLKEGLPS